jgi:hypothetical protein
MAERRNLATWLAAIRACPAIALLIGAAAGAVAAEEAANAPGPTRFEGYPDAPEMTVVPRKDELFFYPCDQCHAAMEPNPEIRALDTMHDAEMEHGRGRIWCLTCHDVEARNYLRTLLDERVDFDAAYLVCGSCHSNKHRDWVFGAHAKRVDNWQGARVQYSCTHCHNAHDPAIEPRAPKAPPRARAGLELERGTKHAPATPWERRQEEGAHD